MNRKSLVIAAVVTASTAIFMAVETAYDLRRLLCAVRPTTARPIAAPTAAPPLEKPAVVVRMHDLAITLPGPLQRVEVSDGSATVAAATVEFQSKRLSTADPRQGAEIALKLLHQEVGLRPLVIHRRVAEFGTDAELIDAEWPNSAFTRCIVYNGRLYTLRIKDLKQKEGVLDSVRIMTR